MSVWVVYILRCADGSLYTGITNNLPKRIEKHNNGTGAKYTRSHRPVKLVWQESADSKAMAQAREAEIKTFAKIIKESLILWTQNKSKKPKRR